jgi:cytoskeletal protein RodZ
MCNGLSEAQARQLYQTLTTKKREETTRKLRRSLPKHQPSLLSRFGRFRLLFAPVTIFVFLVGWILYYFGEKQHENK